MLWDANILWPQVHSALRDISEMRDAEEIKVARWFAGLTDKSLEVELLSDLQYLNHERSTVSLMLLTLWKQAGVC